MNRKPAPQPRVMLKVRGHMQGAHARHMQALRDRGLLEMKTPEQATLAQAAVLEQVVANERALFAAPTVTTVFIVPYRDREADKAVFLAKMHDLLTAAGRPANTWQIIFAHQCDKRPFNRGAMKNIGFLAVKRLYPTRYADLTLVFNDVDTFPTQAGLVHYMTDPGVVSHFYGYKFSLGGIFAIKGGDFERSLGFPNFWGWGLEDNMMQDRCLAADLTIDRNCFYPIKSPLMTQRFDGYNRTLSMREAVVYTQETPDSLIHLANVNFVMQAHAAVLTPAAAAYDSCWTDDTPPAIKNVLMAHVTQFTCGSADTDHIFKPYDIRNGPFIKTENGYGRRVWNMKKMFSA